MKDISEAQVKEILSTCGIKSTSLQVSKLAGTLQNHRVWHNPSVGEWGTIVILPAPGVQDDHEYVAEVQLFCKSLGQFFLIKTTGVQEIV